MAAPLFKVVVKRRLRAPVYDGDSACPCCGGVLDHFGDHALSCECGGDRTIRHNALRNVCHEEALEAGLRSERVKAGLLPKRPSTDELPQCAGNRRPPDVWLPRGQRGSQEALDFAVTSAMRSGLPREATATPELLFQRYEQHERDYKNTAQLCAEAGLCFAPMVMEAHSGGWSPAARGVLDWIAQQSAAANNEDPATVSLRVSRRMSATLHRENMRAISKRSAEQAPAGFDSGWDAQTELLW